jgi:hypothetical protein
MRDRALAERPAQPQVVRACSLHHHHHIHQLNYFHHVHQLMLYCMHEARATITLPDDLAEAVDNYLQAQEAPPALTTVVQAALREYLSERGFLRVRKPLKITPKGNSGRSNVSENHDAYLAGVKK